MIQLKHFKESEFKLPDQMDTTFLLFLDRVRDLCPDVAFVLDCDARTPEHNAEVGGVATSLHLFDPSNESIKARAVDFRIHEFEQHIVPWTSFAKVAEAVIACHREQNLSCGYELEFQYGDTNKHVHLGLFREDGHPSHIVVKADQDVKP